MRVSVYTTAVFLALVLSGCVSFGTSEEQRLLELSDREVSAGEQEFLDRYMENIEYRIFFNENSVEETLLKNTVVRMASACITASKAGKVMIGEPSLKTAVDIEIDVVAGGESRAENHYGFAEVQCTAVESFFKLNLCGFKSIAPKTFSKVSQFDAKANAIQNIFDKMIPETVAQSRGHLLELYSKGLLYELVVRQMPNEKSARDFRRAFALQVRSLRDITDSREEAKYSFAFFGQPEDVKAAVYNTARAVPGLEKIEFSAAEGRKIFFIIGL